MRRRPVLLGLWLGGTLSAMVLASFAVQLASAKVTDRPTAIVSRGQVQTELEEPTTTVVPAPVTTPSRPPSPGPPAPPPTDPTASVPTVLTSPPSTARPGVPATPGPSAPPTTAPSSGPPSTAPPAGPPSSTPDRDGGGGGGGDGDGDGRRGGDRDGDRHDGGGGDVGGGFGGDPTPTTAPAPPATTATYALQGGWVRVRCDRGAISLVTATPNPGYRMQVVDDGPQAIDVRFTNGGHESQFRAVCQDGAIRPDLDESGA